MNKNVFNSVKQGLNEAVIIAKNKNPKTVIYKVSPIDIKNIRINADISKNELASALGVSISTLNYWELGERSPRGPALTLLNIMMKNPGLILKSTKSYINRQ
mgnify:CR=1 FL=1